MLHYYHVRAHSRARLQVAGPYAQRPYNAEGDAFPTFDAAAHALPPFSSSCAGAKLAPQQNIGTLWEPILCAPRCEVCGRPFVAAFGHYYQHPDD